MAVCGVLSSFAGVGHFRQSRRILSEDHARLHSPRSCIAPAVLRQRRVRGRCLVRLLLVIPRTTQPWAAWGIIALLIAVFPANIYLLAAFGRSCFNGLSKAKHFMALAATGRDDCPGPIGTRGPRSPSPEARMSYSRRVSMIKIIFQSWPVGITGNYDDSSLPPLCPLSSRWLFRISAEREDRATTRRRGCSRANPAVRRRCCIVRSCDSAGSAMTNGLAEDQGVKRRRHARSAYCVGVERIDLAKHDRVGCRREWPAF